MQAENLSISATDIKEVNIMSKKKHTNQGPVDNFSGPERYL